jgi:DNA-binding response OmpR family regulator
MIVEDEALIAMSLEDLFEDQGYRVTGPFSSCADALAALARAAPDIAILDATLKDGSCLELARELRRREVPFVMYSGRRAIEEHAPELGGVPWIDKPSPPEFVLSRAVKLLNGSPPEARA